MDENPYKKKLKIRKNSETNFIGAIFWANVPGGNFPGGNFRRGKFSRVIFPGEFSLGTFFLEPKI